MWSSVSTELSLVIMCNVVYIVSIFIMEEELVGKLVRPIEIVGKVAMLLGTFFRVCISLVVNQPCAGGLN